MFLITESTNCATENYPDYKEETNRLASFINRVINKGGSVLIPSFALGKSQEILMRVHTLMKKKYNSACADLLQPDVKSY
jgi:predicted metal-dependent RNase